MQKLIIAVGITGILAISGSLFAITAPKDQAVTIAHNAAPEEAVITETSLSRSFNSASPMQANAYVITWETAGFDKSQKVDINLIEMISESPAIYKFIKKIATNTANDGQEQWMPEDGEFGANSYIEVTCSNSISRNGCRIIGRPVAVSQ